MSIRTIAALAAATVLGLTACGGDNSSPTAGGTAPETATLAPASSALFVSVDTDFDGAQWQQAQTLLEKFPARDKVIDQLETALADEQVDFERDVVPAVGPEVGLVGFDLTSDDPPVVLFTKSPDTAKLKTLLAKGDNPVVTREVDGWTVAAETAAELDRFDRERGAGALADASDFEDALASVDVDGALLAYVGGAGVQKAFDQGLREEGAPPGLSAKLGTLRSFVMSASAEENGVRFDQAVALGDDLGLDTYTPALDEELPAKPLFFLSAANLDTLVRKGLDLASTSVPNFSEQRAQVEKALGLSLEKDVLPLISGEVALALYGVASGDIPVTVDVLVAVDDEADARRLMERLGALLELGDSGTTTKLQIGGVQATELTFAGQDVSVFWLVDDGKLQLSTSRAGLEALQASSPRLADDAAYKDALDASGAPGEVIGLAYADLRTAVPFFVSLEGEDVDADTRANLEPLQSVVASVTQDGDVVRTSGFLGIG